LRVVVQRYVIALDEQPMRDRRPDVADAPHEDGRAIHRFGA
jgi:hypothetical protein